MKFQQGEIVSTVLVQEVIEIIGSEGRIISISVTPQQATFNLRMQKNTHQLRIKVQSKSEIQNMLLA